MSSIGNPFVHKQAKSSLKGPSVKRAGEPLNLRRKHPTIMMGLVRGHCHLKEHLFKLGMADNPSCGRCKQATETASHVLCDCEALAALRLRHLGQHFLKSRDFGHISISRVLHFVQSAGPLNV
jgi:hypothetical protein